MNIEQWLADAQADADRRQLPDLKPLLSALAQATQTLRAAAWNESAAARDSGPACPERVGGEPSRGKSPGLPPSPSRLRRDETPVADPGPEGSGLRTGGTPPLHFWPIASLAPLIASRAISSEDLTRACLGEIDSHNDRLRAFITVTADDALAQARSLDAETARGENRGPLHGIPVSLKDLIDQRGIPTTAASRVRQGDVAATDAPVVARLREAGAVLVGKTNLHEFAFGTTSDDTAYGAVRNPHDDSRSPGGSSGGSAAGIVAGMSVASIGTDTGGSIRIPAAACGVVGLKPTWGEIPCDGVVPLSQSLDHVGPLARTVADAWLLFLVLHGDRAAAAWPLPGRRDVRGLRIGVPRPYFHDILDDEVRSRFAEAMAWLRQAGARTIDVTIPHASTTAAIYQHTSLPEASAYHAETVTQMPERYTPNVRLRIEMGRYLLAEDHARARTGRAVLAAGVDRALDGCDVLALPTLPIPAPPVGAATVDVAGKPESVRNLMLRLTQLFNLTGHPAISIPCGTTQAGLPCGVQLVGRRSGTESLLAAALACEAVIAP